MRFILLVAFLMLLAALLSGCASSNQPPNLQNHGLMIYDLIQDDMQPKRVLKPGEIEI